MSDKIYKTFLQSLREKKDIKIVAIGDSICDGCASDEPGKKWSNLLCGFLKEKYDCSISYHNLAVGGTSSLFGFVRLMRMLPEETADIVLLCYGQNDDEKDFSFFYEGLLRSVLKKFGDAPIICFLESSQREETEKIRDIRKIAAHYNCLVADTINAFSKTYKEYCELSAHDGVHLNDEGQRVYAECLLETIEKADNPVFSSPLSNAVKVFEHFHYIPLWQMDFNNGAYTCEVGGEMIGFVCIETPNGGEYEILLNGEVVRQGNFHHEFEFSWERVYLLSRGKISGRLQIKLKNPADAEFAGGIFTVGV